MAWLEYNSLPVAPSSAYKTAWEFFLLSPVASANTTPLATTAGAGATISRELHLGTSVGCPSCSSTVNATILPPSDAYTQRVRVAVSSQEAKPPRNPLPTGLVFDKA